jgi:hypothetical protein
MKNESSGNYGGASGILPGGVEIDRGKRACAVHTDNLGKSHNLQLGLFESCARNVRCTKQMEQPRS